VKPSRHCRLRGRRSLTRRQGTSATTRLQIGMRESGRRRTPPACGYRPRVLGARASGTVSLMPRRVDRCEQASFAATLQDSACMLCPGSSPPGRGDRWLAAHLGLMRVCVRRVQHRRSGGRRNSTAAQPAAILGSDDRNVASGACRRSHADVRRHLVVTPTNRLRIVYCDSSPRSHGLARRIGDSECCVADMY